MARKARIEGATADPAVIEAAIAAVKAPDPVPGDNGAALLRISEYFQSEFPEEWALLRLCPLQHGLEAMVEKLKG